jgi:hypothetical protein
MAYADPIRTNQATFETTADLIDGVKSEIDTGTSFGWWDVTETFTYASASTITVASGAASRFQIGDKLRLTNSTLKYFYIIGVADTVLTVTGGSDYTLANTTITNVSISRVSGPFGFPQYFNYSSNVIPQAGSAGSITFAFARFQLNARLATVTFEVSYAQSGSSAAFVDVVLPISPAFAQTPPCGSINPDGGTMSSFCFTATPGTGTIRNWAYDQRSITVGTRGCSNTFSYII